MNWMQFIIFVIVFILSVLFITAVYLYANTCKFQNAKAIIDFYFQRKEQHYNEMIKSGLDISKYN